MQKARLLNILAVLVLISFLPLVVIAGVPAKQTTDTPPESKPESWQTFTSPEGRFSIEFPGKPSPTNQPAGPSGNVTLHMYSLGTLAAYGVSYFDFSDEGADGARKALDLAIQGVIKDYGSDNLTVSEIELEAHPARLLTKLLANGYMLRVKAVVVGARQYQITSVVPKQQIIGPQNIALYESASSRFLDSFKLVSETKDLGEVDRWRKDHPEAEVYGVLDTDKSISYSDADRSKLAEVKGRALELAKPAYPAIAKAAKASGTVVVQVIVDETGAVVAAQALSGHPLLYGAAVQAARNSKFKPPQIEGKPVSFTGVINYNFIPQ
jgi:TonB family protein